MDSKKTTTSWNPHTIDERAIKKYSYFTASVYFFIYIVFRQHGFFQHFLIPIFTFIPHFTIIKFQRFKSNLLSCTRKKISKKKDAPPTTNKTQQKCITCNVCNKKSEAIPFF